LTSGQLALELAFLGFKLGYHLDLVLGLGLKLVDGMSELQVLCGGEGLFAVLQFDIVGDRILGLDQALSVRGAPTLEGGSNFLHLILEVVLLNDRLDKLHQLLLSIIG
jgi:hypothetical protein